MNVFWFFFKTSWLDVLSATLIASISGLCSALLIALVNNGVNHTNALTERSILLFIGLLIVTAISGIASQYVLVRLSQTAIYSLRLRLSHKILACPLRQLEKLGNSRILATLTEDIHTISAAILLIPFVFINIATIVGCLVYLGLLYWQLLLLSLIAIIGASFLIQFLFLKAENLFRLAREEQDQLFKHLRSLTDGIKELKLNAQRRREFIEKELQSSASLWRHYNITSMSILGISTNVAQILFFIIIGGLVFGLPHVTNVDTKILSGYVLVITYLIGPLKQVMAIMPELGQAGVALEKIDNLGLSLTDNSDKSLGYGSPSLKFMQSLELCQVTHAYQQEKQDNSFTIGPIDLKIVKGEVIFIIGGNGSGKSTLAKLITGLYLPESGQIVLDNIPINDENREAYRQLFATVFSDFYLFERFLGIDSDNLHSQASQYLQLLQLNHKVTIKDHRLSTVELSQGQQKRLALLTAYLEDRSIYLFDEWAADQDPCFKQIFYTQLLPELKHRGKTVLAITHDDRYFDLADRIIKLDYGQLIENQQPQFIEYETANRIS